MVFKNRSKNGQKMVKKCQKRVIFDHLFFGTFGSIFSPNYKYNSKIWCSKNYPKMVKKCQKRWSFLTTFFGTFGSILPLICRQIWKVWGYKKGVKIGLSWLILTSKTTHFWVENGQKSPPKVREASKKKGVQKDPPKLDVQTLN